MYPTLDELDELECDPEVSVVQHPTPNIRRFGVNQFSGLEYDPAVNLVRHPTPNIRRFGVNQFSEPLFRIVWSESVRHLIGGLWPTGETGYRWVKTYKWKPGLWVLEQWRMPSESIREWERMTDPVSNFPVLGPYPARGYYELAYVFDFGVDSESLDTIIGKVRRKETRSFQDDRDLLQARYDQEEKTTSTNTFETCRDAVSYKPLAALSYGRHGRGTKTAPDLKSAEELGLRVPRGRRPVELDGGLGMTTNLRGA